MNAYPTRREFLKAAAALPASAIIGGGILAAPFADGATPIQRVGGPNLKLSLNAYSFNGALLGEPPAKPPSLTLFELMEFCAKHDFDAIDPTGYYFPGYPAIPSDQFINDIKHRAFQLGLAISGTGVRNDFAQLDAAKRAADVALAKSWIEVAAKLGTPVIRVFAGAIPKGYENKWDEAAKGMIEALRECAEHGRKCGVVVGVQNHGDMLRSADQVLSVIQQVDSPWFGTVVDIGNMQTADPYDDIARVVPYAVNWQVKTSVYGPNGPVRTDLPRLARIIKAGGFRGYVPIETLATKDTPYDPWTAVPAFATEVRAALAGQA